MMMAGKVEYQPPMVLNVTPGNAPTVSQNFKVQIDGRSFGFYDSTPKATLVGTACAGIRWTSDSTISCYVSHGRSSPSCGEYETERACYDARCNTEASFTDPSCRIIQVQVGGQRGSLVGLFSYDQLEVLRLEPTNAPATGAINVTLHGSNFGIYSEYGHKARVGNRPCASSLWTSDSSISCEVCCEEKEWPEVGIIGKGAAGGKHSNLADVCVCCVAFCSC